MRTLRWEAEANRQYRDSLTYIAAQNPTAAERLAVEISRKLDLLVQFPEMGRKGRVARTRELVVHPNYLVIYAVRARTIDVIRFLHARQPYP
jgi:addiction module RelE/StbE family toxin